MTTLQELRNALLRPNNLLQGFGVETSRLPRTRRRPTRRRPLKLPRQKLPTTISLEYAQALTAAVARLQAMVRERVLPLLRTDAMRQDAPSATDGEINDTIEEIGAEWWKKEGAKLEKLAGTTADRVSIHQAEELRKQFSSASVQMGLRQRPSARAGQAPKLPLLRNALVEFQKENVSLIKSIPEKALGRLQDVLTSGQAKGRTPEQIARDIEGEFEVTKRRALLIARDQTMTLSEKLNRERQKAIGVTEYTWRARSGPEGDGKNRPMHLALHGTRQKLNTPPVVDSLGNRAHPGVQITCRCTAEPILDTDDKWQAWWEGEQ